MHRAIAIILKGEVERYSEAVPLLKTPGDAVFVYRGVPRSLVMQCPDGCGTLLTVNLDPRSGKAWRVYSLGSLISLYPSIWRVDGCRSHFIIYKELILWCGQWTSRRPLVDDSLLKKVMLNLPRREFSYYESLADLIGEMPWDVLWACQKLVADGLAMQQPDKKFYGYYKAIFE